jgi:ribonuclease G
LALLLEQGAPVEASLDADQSSRVGEIHDGRVTRVEVARGMVWIDLGPTGHGMLDLGKTAPVEGAAIRVQIARDAQGGKQLGLRQRLEMAGTGLILIPGGEAIEIPRALGPAQRSKLRTTLGAMAQPGEGWVARSTAAEMSDAALAAEVAHLRSLAPPMDIAPGRRVWSPGSATVQTLRRWRALHPNAPMICDNGALTASLRAAGFADLTPHRAGGAPPLSPYADRLASALTTQCDLPQGGALHVETTRALTAIDVDLGGAATREGALTAADIVGQEIRWRALSGLILVDFPRQTAPADRQRLRDRLASALAPCAPPCEIMGFTRAGLLEITRPRGTLPWTRLATNLDAFLTAPDEAS